MDFDRFGSGVTVIELAPGLIAREDADVSEAVTAILKNERIDVHVETTCLLVERHGRDMESVAGSPSGIVIRKLRDGGTLFVFESATLRLERALGYPHLPRSETQDFNGAAALRYV